MPLAERYGWTANQVADMTPAQLMPYLLKSDKRGNTVKMSLAEARRYMSEHTGKER